MNTYPGAVSNYDCFYQRGPFMALVGQFMRNCEYVFSNRRSTLATNECLYVAPVILYYKSLVPTTYHSIKSNRIIWIKSI